MPNARKPRTTLQRKGSRVRNPGIRGVAAADQRSDVPVPGTRVVMIRGLLTMIRSLLLLAILSGGKGVRSQTLPSADRLRRRLDALKNPGINCWLPCGRSAGACPEFCGVSGGCCKKNDADACGVDGGSTGYHGCDLLETATRPPTGNILPKLLNENENCWRACGSRAGSCSNFCGEDGGCCKPVSARPPAIPSRLCAPIDRGSFELKQARRR